MSDELNATVTRRDEINHGLLVLQVTPDDELPPFVAGQYTVLGLPGSASRKRRAAAMPPGYWRAAERRPRSRSSVSWSMKW